MHTEPDDIVQGALGDCYFLSSLSVLADEAPWAIEALFREHIPNKRGVYAVTFFLDGAVRTVVVDDRFPCDPKTKKPLFSRNRGNEIWVMTVEKAYAKAYGSYRAIESGSPGDALADLTGAPVHTFHSADIANGTLWKRLVKAKRAGHVLAAGVPNFANRDIQREVGLVEGHAYAVLDVNDDVVSGDDEKLVKLRNPWGKVEWHGAWGDSDRRWTPELKQRLGWVNADDGCFWMNCADFARYFDVVTLLLLDRSWTFTSCPCELASPKTQFALEVTEPAAVKLYLTACQVRGRSTVSVRMCVLEEKTLIPLGGTEGTFVLSETLSSARITVKPGVRCIVLVEVFPEHSRFLPVPFSLSCSSDRSGVQLTCIGSASKDLEFVLPEFAEKYGTCGACSLPLAGSYMAVQGKKYHGRCFHCSSCGADISAGFFIVASKFVCRRCKEKPPTAATSSAPPPPPAAAVAPSAPPAKKPPAATSKKPVAAKAPPKRTTAAAPTKPPAKAPATKPATSSKLPSAKPAAKASPVAKAAPAAATKKKAPVAAKKKPAKKEEVDAEEQAAVLVESERLGRK